MRISIIELNNFGPYEGTNSFDTRADAPDERIVIIGGKNGAGKTTLFTAIKVCLYGHVAFGFKAAGKKYVREIETLINNQAKLIDRESAYVRIVFSEDRIDTDIYEVIRSWSWPEGVIEESLSVWKNGVQVDEEALSDFGSFLCHLIPPALLDLYFFDGEKIADYFFGDQKDHIKEAVLTLSGSDTYDILYTDIRKLINGVESDSNSVAQDYADQREVLAELCEKKGQLEQLIHQLTEERDRLETEAKSLHDHYSASGGISLNEWKELQRALKDEEAKRERLNWELKQIAATVLPLLIVSGLLSQIKKQILDERNANLLSILHDSLSAPEFESFFQARVGMLAPSASGEDINLLYDDIKGFFSHPELEATQRLFALSEDETVAILNTISEAERFDQKTFSKYRKRIRKSIEVSKGIRDKLQNSSIENYETYIGKMSSLQLEIGEHNLQIESNTSELAQLNSTIEATQKDLAITRKALEEEIKRNSIASLSDRTLLLVEELQALQHQKIITAVEKDINAKFQELLRKDGFVDYIRVDSDFSIHLIRNESIEFEKIREIITRQGVHVLKRRLNPEAFSVLLEKLGGTEDNLPYILHQWEQDSIDLPVEQDIIQLSNGERQILVMALYWAIMKQSDNELPFIIDTPFARIDTEHRANITEHFFKELPGQLFILSTNEELKSEHLASLEGQIIRVFTLDYSVDRKTNVVSDSYFEVNDGI